MRAPLPEFEGVEWVEGVAAQSDALAGKPVLVQFWSVGCGICHEVADRVSTWRDRYAERGLEFVAVHQPRSPAELDATRVAEDARGAMQIAHPCAVDSTHTIVDRFDNRIVPAYYLFDRNHQLRHFQAGDKGYDRIESAIERVLAGTDDTVQDGKAPEPQV